MNLNLASPLYPDVDFAVAELPDLHALLAELREQAAVVPVIYHGAPTWLITRFAELRAAFSDEEHFACEAAYRVPVSYTHLTPPTTYSVSLSVVAVP